MRQLFFFCSITIILCIFFSCKKDSGTVSTNHIVTYKITSNNYQSLSNISYTDTSGAPAFSSAVDSTSGWSATIPVLYSPYVAELQVQGQNSSSGNLTYALAIYEDGTLKSMQQDTAAAFESFENQISVTIQ